MIGLCLLALALVLPACASLSLSGPPAVPITSFAGVAGKWEGLVTWSAPSRRDDWVELAIAGDGRYQFGSFRLIGTAMGGGQLTLKDGQLSSASERGQARYVLHEGEGTRQLRVTGGLPDGRTFDAVLTPAR